MGISHPTFLHHQVSEAVAVGIANARHQDAINELFLLAPSIDDPPSCVTLALGDIQRRLIRHTESNGNAEEPSKTASQPPINVNNDVREGG